VRLYTGAEASLTAQLSEVPHRRWPISAPNEPLQQAPIFCRIDGVRSRDVRLRLAFSQALQRTHAHTQHELKRFEEALASYDRALTVRPDYAQALSNRGTTLRELKRFEEALASYDRALTVRPEYAEALSNRGLVLTVLGHLSEARAALERAVELGPCEVKYRGLVIRCTLRCCPSALGSLRWPGGF
jgi:tetratricopeptide (TPR) repeat protein